jgi:hypothetical protein
LFDFENDAQGWQSRQAESTVGRTSDAANVKSGQGALEWTYNASLDTATLGVLDPPVPAGASTFSFWVKCSTATNAQVLLIEKTGAVYVTVLRLPAGQWAHYRVRLGDFVLGPESQDANGQLDADQLRLIQFMDSSRFTAPDTNSRKLWLDGVDFNGEPAPQRRVTDGVAPKPELLVDDFDEEALGWEGGLSAELSLVKSDGRSTLKAVYEQGKGSPRELVLNDHLDGRYGLAKSLRLVARAERKTTLRVRVREWDGGYQGPEYDAAFEIPAGKEWSSLVLPLSKFTLVEGSKDPDGKLNPEKVWLLELRDMTPGDAPVRNELEIDRLSAVLQD